MSDSDYITIKFPYFVRNKLLTEKRQVSYRYVYEKFGVVADQTNYPNIKFTFCFWNTHVCGVPQIATICVHILTVFHACD